MVCEYLLCKKLPRKIAIHGAAFALRFTDSSDTFTSQSDRYGAPLISSYRTRMSSKACSRPSGVSAHHRAFGMTVGFFQFKTMVPHCLKLRRVVQMKQSHLIHFHSFSEHIHQP